MQAKKELDAVDRLAGRTREVVCLTRGLEGPCWVVRSTLPGGYTNMKFRGKVWLVHRVAFTVLVDEIPEGYQVDHLCYRPSCWNQAHLEVVTRAVNMARSRKGNRGGKPTEKCQNGHPWTPENTARTRDRRGRDGYIRECRTCMNARRRARYAENRELNKIFS